MLTGVAHELAGDLLVAAAAAEDLATEPAVVAASEGGELFVAVVALFALAVRHPVLLQVTVLVWAKDTNTTHREPLRLRGSCVCMCVLVSLY